MMTAVPNAEVAAVCQYPENMRGKTLQEMSPADILCSKYTFDEMLDAS